MPYGAGHGRRTAGTRRRARRPQTVGGGLDRGDVRAVPALGHVLPAMGYSAEQLDELARTIRAVDCDVVVSGTPVDLERLVDSGHPIRRARRTRVKVIGRPRPGRRAGTAPTICTVTSALAGVRREDEGTHTCRALTPSAVAADDLPLPGRLARSSSAGSRRATRRRSRALYEETFARRPVPPLLLGEHAAGVPERWSRVEERGGSGLVAVVSDEGGRAHRRRSGFGMLPSGDGGSRSRLPTGGADGSARTSSTCSSERRPAVASRTWRRRS